MSAATNALAYDTTVFITGVKRFIVQAAGQHATGHLYLTEPHLS